MMPELLAPGMYVRVAVADGEDEGVESDFRAFRLAQLSTVDPKSGLLSAIMFKRPLGSAYAQETVSCRIEHARRCAVFPGSSCLHNESGRAGTVLTTVDDAFACGEPRRYFVAFDGKVAQFAETELIVPGDAQDPDPRLQLADYELHEPGWRSLRDPVVQTVAELRNATYGLEELVGARVLILPHQAEVITRALGDTTCRFVLADEVGLGKTIEAAVILRGLRRRNPRLRTLIITPASLTHQWMNELNSKFWIDVDIVDSGDVDIDPESGGVIVSADALSSSPRLRKAVAARAWDCLIVDEAHHVRKTKELQSFLIEVSYAATSVLVLSATPIERRGGEYLDLLRLMDPVRFVDQAPDVFQTLLDAQAEIRSWIEYNRPTLSPGMYDPDEFMEEFDRLLSLLPRDDHLARLNASARTAGEPELDLAIDVVTHVNTNYRVEHRVVRNRRAHLETELPKRAVESMGAYNPSAVERDALEQMMEYCAAALSAYADAIMLEYVRLLLHAGASSPQAVTTLLASRALVIERVAAKPAVTFDDLLTVRGPREEPDRIAGVVKTAPTWSGEASLLPSLIAAVRHWSEETEARLAEITLRNVGDPSIVTHRIPAVVRAVHQLTQQRADGNPGKAIVFATWPESLDALAMVLRHVYGARAYTQFRAGMSGDELEQAADRFQLDRSCQVLLTDELGGEGRNFQIADGIVHLDLPWSPARIEQRIGRVDRLGRSGTVISVVPYARETIEADLFKIWHEAFELFTRSMSGLEIALEEVQAELVAALRTSVRHGLEHLFPALRKRFEAIRDQVERECYFEEGAINQRQRAELDRVREKYRDGKVLQGSTLAWATWAGLRPETDPTSGIVTFSPKSFNKASMIKANIMTLPDITEAIRRVGRRNQQSIRGTFNRDLAIVREDLVFYAPGDDPWFEWIVQNAERADRGRCCAILRCSSQMTRNWKGLELFYRIEVDPRPLYAAGFDPVYLQRARGYLRLPTHRILISEEGKVLSPASAPAQAIQGFFQKGGVKGDIHLGQRGGNPSPLSYFTSQYPRDAWMELMEELVAIGDRTVREEFSFLDDLGNEARLEFEAQLRDSNAVKVWQGEHLGKRADTTGLRREQQLIDALVAGISRPAIRLESACFWWLLAVKG